MTSIFTWPQRDEEFFNEVRGEMQVRKVPDIPQITLKNEFNELKGVYEDVTRDMTDAEVVAAGLVPGMVKRAAKKKAKKAAKRK